jgi:hypothetical protein
MYDHRNTEPTAEFTCHQLDFPPETNRNGYTPTVHDMLTLSANPELTPEMPSSLFHVQPVASRGSLGTLSRSRL